MWDSWVVGIHGWEDWTGRKRGCFAGIGFLALTVFSSPGDSMESW